MTKTGSKTETVYFQLRLSPHMNKRIDELVEDYDPLLSKNHAILKIIGRALDEWYIPGYLRKEHVQHRSMEERENEKHGDGGTVSESGDFKDTGPA